MSILHLPPADSSPSFRTRVDRQTDTHTITVCLVAPPTKAQLPDSTLLMFSHSVPYCLHCNHDLKSIAIVNSDSNTEIPNNVSQNTCQSSTLPNSEFIFYDTTIVTRFSLAVPRSSLLIAIVGGSLGGSLILLGLAIAIVYSYWKGKLRISKTTPSHVRRDASWFNFQVTNQLAVSPTYAPDKNKTFKNFPHPGSPTMQAVPVS